MEVYLCNLDIYMPFWNTMSKLIRWIVKKLMKHALDERTYALEMCFSKLMS